MNRATRMFPSLFLALTLLFAMCVPVGAAIETGTSGKTYRIGRTEYGATIQFPTLLGMTEVKVGNGEGELITKQSVLVVQNEGIGRDWFSLKDPTGAVQKAMKASGMSGVVDAYGAAFQIPYWRTGEIPFGKNLETISKTYGFTAEQGFLLESEEAFVWYPGQFGGDLLTFDANGNAHGTGYTANTQKDPYLHMFNLDIGSGIVAADGTDLGQIVLVVPANHLSSFVITPAPRGLDGTGAIAADTSATCTPNRSAVLYDGAPIAIDAYTIKGNNYFKLRDVAKLLSGSGKQFDVSWNTQSKSIQLVSGKPYTVVGGELALSSALSTVNAKQSASPLLLDGEAVSLTAYTINGNNYFKLRDLGKALNFGVSWNSQEKSIEITSTAGYSE